MVAYLSEDWVRALDEALAGVVPPHPEGTTVVTVQFEVVDGPSGDHCWHLTLGSEGARAVAGPAAEPTVTFTQPWTTALAVARGDRSTQEALLAGEVRMAGDPTRLVAWRRAVQAVDASLARMNASTTFPSAGTEG